MVKRGCLSGNQVRAHVVAQGVRVVIVDKCVDGFLQAEGADDQHIAAQDANERQE